MLEYLPRILGSLQHRPQHPVDTGGIDPRDLSDLASKFIGTDLIEFVEQPEESHLSSLRQTDQAT